MGCRARDIEVGSTQRRIELLDEETFENPTTRAAHVYFATGARG